MEFDLHLHSKYSFDSKMEIFEIIETAKRVGLDGIAVTDHETVEGGRRAKLLGDPRLIIIPGIEIHSDIGDIIGLYVNKDIEYTDPFDIVKAIHDQGGIAILPHPFRGRGKVPVKLMDVLDGIECFNGRYSSTTPTHKQVPRDHVQRLAHEHGLATFGVGDAHNYNEIGRGTTIIDAYTESGIKEAILNQETTIGKQGASTGKKLSSTINTLLNPQAEEHNRCIIRSQGFYEVKSIEEVKRQQAHKKRGFK